jgi:hypothetical protein
MPVMITALYAAILALLLTALAINVTVNRAKLKVLLGDGGNPQMLRMARIHGNAAEYVPIAVLLMGLYELDGGLPLALHVTGIASAACCIRGECGPKRSPASAAPSELR